MKKDGKPSADRGERTLLLSLIMSAPGALVTVLAALSSRSATQIADCVRRVAELVATAVSYAIYRKLHRDAALAEESARARLERAAQRCVALAMLCSGALMLLIAASRFRSGAPGGNVTMGLAIAVLGLVTNSWFWLRYRAMARGPQGAILGAQSKLYSAKSVVDFCVTVALLTVALAPTHPATRYVDGLGSVVVAGYLMGMGARMLRRHMAPAPLS